MQETQRDLEVPKFPSLKELVKDNNVVFSHYRAENFYYNVQLSKESLKTSPTIGGPTSLLIEELEEYQFPVPIDDIGNATMLAEDKAMLFMRWIRAAIEDKTLIKL